VPFLAMQFLKGEALDDRLKREERLPASEVARIGREAALGLAAAHARDLVHRDIKPANLWLEEGTGRVKILDFGLARAAADSAQITQSGAIIGTPAYMAPEQANGKPVDGRTDLFSLGCVLYRMCTGVGPFAGKDTLSTLLAVASQDPSPAHEVNPDVPRKLSDLVMRLLAKAPEDRPPSAAEVVDLLAGLDRQAPETRTAKLDKGTRESVARKTRQKAAAASPRWLWPAVIGGGVAVVIVTVAMVILFRKTPEQTAPITAGPEKPGTQPKQTPATAPDAFFNGHDLAGWEGLPRYWSVKNNAIVGSTLPDGIKLNTFLCSQKSYRDFELKFQVRLIGVKANSGVQIRSRLANRDTLAVFGHQVDMGEGYWGSIYGEGIGGMAKMAPQEKVLQVFKKDDFNDFLIRCTGKHVLVRLNGLTTVDDDFDNLPSEGIIAWQLHTGPGMEVTFRSIEFKELADAPSSVALFNGPDLSGWEKIGSGGWTAANGVLRGQGDKSPGWLASPRDYADFELELEYRLPPKGNSGVFVHAWKEGEINGGQFLEIQLIDDDGYDTFGKLNGTGAIFGVLAPKPAVKSIPGVWHKLAVRSQGRRIQVFFEGQQVVNTNLDEHAGSFERFPGLKRTTGRIGLQQYGDSVEFRNVRLRER